MSQIAEWLSRHVWFFTLWLIRRRWIKRLQSASIAWLPAKARLSAEASLVRQNRFARRYGLRLIRFFIYIMLASLFISMTTLIATELYVTGALSVPDELRNRIGPQD